MESPSSSVEDAPLTSRSMVGEADAAPQEEDAADNDEGRANSLRQCLRESIEVLSRRRRPMNILIVGKPCQGKSAFLQTSAIAASKKWNQFVMVGSEGGTGKQYMTANLKRVNLMYPYEDDPMYPEGAFEEDPFLKQHSPRIFDAAGMPDEDNAMTRAVFRRILYGGIPNGTSLLNVIREVSEPNGVEYVRKKYWQRDDDLAIDRIVVVMSAIEDHPRELVRALIKAAQPKGIPDPDDGFIYKRAVPVFGLITMMDKIKGMNPSEKQLFSKRKESFISSLGMRGMVWRLGECTNYISTAMSRVPITERRNDPNIDCKVLRFLGYLMDPFLRVEHEMDVPISSISYMQTIYSWLEFLRDLPSSKIILTLLVLLVAFLFGFFVRLIM